MEFFHYFWKKQTNKQTTALTLVQLTNYHAVNFKTKDLDIVKNVNHIGLS